MYSIWKYTLTPAFEQTIEIPKNTAIISAKEQYGNIVIYGTVDLEEKEKVLKKIIVLPTGYSFNLPNNLRFIDTVMLSHGELVFHVCEITE